MFLLEKGSGGSACCQHPRSTVAMTRVLQAAGLVISAWHGARSHALVFEHKFQSTARRCSDVARAHSASRMRTPAASKRCASAASTRDAACNASRHRALPCGTLDLLRSWRCPMHPALTLARRPAASSCRPVRGSRCSMRCVYVFLRLRPSDGATASRAAWCAMPTTMPWRLQRPIAWVRKSAISARSPMSQ